MEHDVRGAVKAAYGSMATGTGGCCGSVTKEETALRLGYAEVDVLGVAKAGNLGLGCGNPTALAALQPGEIVVDLGSGAGFDALVAAPKLGAEGRFIGVDMTPEMLEKSRRHAVEAGFARTVEFREGVIEDLPVPNDHADVVISNCVINLSPDKPRVFREAFRVLKPGGRLAITDIVLTEPIPEVLQGSVAGWIACVGGAVTEAEYVGALQAAGFVDVGWERKPAAALLEGFLADPVVKEAIALVGQGEIDRVAHTVYSYALTARKP